MPLSAKAQAERRARLKKFETPKKIPRRRCANCDKPFPRTKPNRKFCGKQCKREYEQNGGTAFGPLKTRLEKLVWGITAELERRLNVQGRAIGNLERVVFEAFPNEFGLAPSQSPSQPSPSETVKTSSAPPGFRFRTKRFGPPQRTL
jgi:hypothetical protein